MAKVTKSSLKGQRFYGRAEDDRDNPCCGKPSTSAKDIQKPVYPHLNQKAKGGKKNDSSKMS